MMLLLSPCSTLHRRIVRSICWINTENCTWYQRNHAAPRDALLGTTMHLSPPLDSTFTLRSMVTMAPRRAPFTSNTIRTICITHSSTSRSKCDFRRWWSRNSSTNGNGKSSTTATPSNSSSIVNNNSNAASSTDWIPPTQPLAGDRGQSHQYPHIGSSDPPNSDGSLDDRLDSNDEINIDDDTITSRDSVVAESSAAVSELIPPAPAPVDWLKTRRVRQGQQPQLDNTFPNAGERNIAQRPRGFIHHDPQLQQQHYDDAVPVREHTLLTSSELVRLLSSRGGIDIIVMVLGDKTQGGANLVGRLGPDVQGVILTTGLHSAHLKLLTDTVVRHLRVRNLHKVGVMGATHGADGSMRDPNERWFVVDCHNYIVHIQDAKTRKAIDLEGLWSGQDGLHQLDLTNEAAVEDYVADHPVPDDYNPGTSAIGDWDETVRQLEKHRWTTTGTVQRQTSLLSKRAAATRSKRRRSGRNS